MSLASRGAAINAKPAELTVDLFLLPTCDGGRAGPIAPGYGCPCKVARDSVEAWDGFPQLGGEPMSPGETRRLGYVFLSGEAAAHIFRAAGRFFLWEGRIVGEAIVVSPDGHASQPNATA